MLCTGLWPRFAARLWPYLAVSSGLSVTASTESCCAVGSKPCFALGFGPRFAAGLWPYLAVGSGPFLPRLCTGHGPRFAARLWPYLAVCSGLSFTASTESCRAVGSEPRLVLGSGPRFVASSEPCLALGSEPRLAVGPEPRWDLPCLGYQACCFNCRTIGVACF